MKARILTVGLLAALALSVSLVGAQDDMMKIYPQQYATIADWVAAGGADITSFNGPEIEGMPPAAERLPSEPAVVDPLEGIGVYGGELAGPSTNPVCCGWDALETRLQKLLTIDTDLATIIPNVAKGIEASDDQSTYTIHLREGHKWSDGHPFTAEDFRFYLEDVLGNESLTPGWKGPWGPNGQLPQLEIHSETSFTVTFHRAYPTFPVALGSEVGNRGYLPAHYFQQFHIGHNEGANDLAAEEGFEDWVQLFNARKSPYNFTWDLGRETDPNGPTLNTFVYVSTDAFGNKYYERNPYFFKIDTAGNQLPYTDSLKRILVEDLQVQDLKAVAGEYSHYGWGILLNYSTYRDGEENGGYRTALTRYNRGNEYVCMLNHTHPDEALRELFLDVRLRQAMNVAIDRNEINELVYFGLATASQSAPTPVSAFYKPWMTTHWAQYDPDLANQLLDEMGMGERDGDGWRLRPDGEPFSINMQVSVPEEAWQKIGELMASYWQAVGLNVQYKLIEIGLYNELRNSAQHDIACWGYDVTDIGEYSNSMTNLRPHWGARHGAHGWRIYMQTDGADGIEPPNDIKLAWLMGDRLLESPYGSDEYHYWGNQMNDLVFGGTWFIGVIQLPPQPLLFDVDLRNTPPNDTEGLWSWSYRQWVMFMPEQWSFGLADGG